MSHIEWQLQRFGRSRWSHSNHWYHWLGLVRHSAKSPHILLSWLYNAYSSPRWWAREVSFPRFLRDLDRQIINTEADPGLDEPWGKWTLEHETTWQNRFRLAQIYNETITKSLEDLEVILAIPTSITSCTRSLKGHIHGFDWSKPSSFSTVDGNNCLPCARALLI